MLKNLGVKPFSTISTFKNKQQESSIETKQLLNEDKFVKSSSILSFKETVSDANTTPQLPAEIIEIKGNTGKIEKLEGQSIFTSHNNNPRAEIGSMYANNVRLVGGTCKVGTITTFDLPDLKVPGEVTIIGNHIIETISAAKAKIVNYETNKDDAAIVSSVTANNIHLGGNATVVKKVNLIGNNAKLEIDSKPQVKVIDFSEATSATLTLSNKSSTETNHESAKILNGKDASTFTNVLGDKKISTQELSQAFPGFIIKSSSVDDLYYAKINKPNEHTKKSFSPLGVPIITQTNNPEIFISSKPVSLQALQEQFELEIIGKPASITTIFEEPRKPFSDKQPRFKTIIYPVIRTLKEENPSETV